MSDHEYKHHEHRSDGHSHHHGHGHHRHHRNPQKARRERMINIMTVVLVAAVVVVAGVIVIRGLGNREVNTTAERESTTGAYRNITVDGKDYEFNNLIQTVLYIGVDSEGAMETSQAYGSAPRSDTVMLFVLDEYQKKLSILSFNRNSMLEIEQYDVSGNRLTPVTKQLAYAFAAGNGGSRSADITVDTISDLLGGIPIDRYLVMNRSSIPYINQMLGGVTVTLPDDSLADEFPGFTEGTTVTLTDEEAEAFVRYRDTDVAFSNDERMERQRVYVLAAINKLKDTLLKDPENTWEELNDSQVSDYILTDITRGQYLDFVNILGNLDLSQANFYIPEGVSDDSEELEKYYINENSLKQLVLDIFYLED